MATVGQGPDALRFFPSGGLEDRWMFSSGTLPGIAVNRACDRNGDGIGHLRLRSGRLSWRAPGSAVFGPEEDVLSGGQIRVGDADPTKYLIVTAYPAYLPVGERSAAVRLRHRQGRINTFELSDPPVFGSYPAFEGPGNRKIKNIGSQTLVGLKCWFGAETAAWFDVPSGNIAMISLASNGAGAVSPVSEATALALGNLAPNAILNLYYAIEISNAVPGDELIGPDVPFVVEFSWDGN